MRGLVLQVALLLARRGIILNGTCRKQIYLCLIGLLTAGNGTKLPTVLTPRRAAHIAPVQQYNKP